MTFFSSFYHRFSTFPDDAPPMTERPNFMRATLQERVDFSNDVAMFRFQPDGAFEFTPGQYATIGIEDGEKFIQRAYSVVSSPRESHLEFYIELVPDGMMTPRLWDFKPGAQILVKNKIIGTFVIQEKTGMKQHVMASTVTGVGPSISIARTQKRDLDSGKLSAADAHKLLVVQGASRSWEFGSYDAELRDIARDGWLEYVPTISRPWEDEAWTGETGRVEDIVRKYADAHGYNHTNAVGYACGHPQMIENVKGIFSRSRFPKEQIKEEKYFVIRPAAPAVATTTT
jgi:ferredoxin/flavodoxin---NADP+ reductase